MGLTDAEFAVLLDDRTKRVDGDIEWSEDEDHSPSVEFKVPVQSEAGYTLTIKGSFNRLARKLTFALFDPRVGRLYALDLGSDHTNPNGEKVGTKHKHRWSEVYRDKDAYRPDDITAGPTDVVLAWKQFCAEAHIHHDGVMRPPEARQEPLFI